MTEKEVLEMANSYLLSGMPIVRGDQALDKLLESISAVLNQHMKDIRAAIARYLDDEDQDAFFLSLLPVHLRIWYEAYAPYWLKHCHLVCSRDDDTEFTYYNDLIDMYWSWQWQEWKRKGKWEVTIMLPPTKGLIALQYQEDVTKNHWL